MDDRKNEIGSVWAAVLSIVPDETLEKNAPWELFSGEDWGRLLKNQPRFAKYCRWDLLSGWDWGFLLAEQPQFAEHCKWEKLSGTDWMEVLRKQPQFAQYCKWEKMDIVCFSILCISAMLCRFQR